MNLLRCEGNLALTIQLQAFHTDDGDIVALYYASLVEQGGRTQLASQSKVYNELAAKRPDLVEVLVKDWFIDT
jgi:hypothetical protein